MDDSMDGADGAIDVVCNLFTPQEVRQGQTGVDEYFLDQVRFPPELRSGVPLETYLEKMDRAGIQRSLLIAVRAGDMRMKGSFEIPYERVAEICQHYRHWPEPFVHFINTWGKDKVLFGTDWPVIDPERAIKEINALELRPESKQKFLRDTALRLFRLPESLTAR